MDTRPYMEESASELAAPIPVERERPEPHREEVTEGGRGIGYAALILSILALFTVPVLFGAAGIILGFMARRRGSEGLGAWAVGIGTVSIIMGLFVLPFF
nr:DUF4190 domain-containing protein [Bacillus ectoiniformans]